MGRHHVLDVLCGVVVGIIQFYIVQYLWLSPELCEKIMLPILEELHL